MSCERQSAIFSEGFIVSEVRCDEGIKKRFTFGSFIQRICSLLTTGMMLNNGAAEIRESHFLRLL